MAVPSTFLGRNSMTRRIFYSMLTWNRGIMWDASLPCCKVARGSGKGMIYSIRGFQMPISRGKSWAGQFLILFLLFYFILSFCDNVVSTNQHVRILPLIIMTLLMLKLLKYLNRKIRLLGTTLTFQIYGRQTRRTRLPTPLSAHLLIMASCWADDTIKWVGRIQLTSSLSLSASSLQGSSW
ncbi:hypothetical protein BC941DRAFT_91396 [Chlamydoabsidia padenii]|nr:hypothetical protein BC941DRAFT_91396 [Chlamydoabsidia padenii]